jgi:glutathione S-transferase
MVPALKLDGRRVQGSRAIACSLEAARPTRRSSRPTRPRAVGADEAAVRRALDDLPGMLARVDALVADGVLTPAAPDAATLQVLYSVRALDGFADLHDQVAAHPCAVPARELFPDYPEIPAFLPFS